MEDYNPKSPDQYDFQQTYLEPPVDPGLAIIQTDNGAVLQTGDFSSPNYATGQSGWTINSDGSAEFQNVIISGNDSINDLPKPITYCSGVTNVNPVGNTAMHIGAVMIPISIEANKISINSAAVTVAGAYLVSLYSIDGITRYFSVSTGNIAAPGFHEMTITPTTNIPNGYYWIGIQPISTANVSFTYFDSVTGADNFISATGKPRLVGVYSVTADTSPTGIIPTSIAAGVNDTLMFRLDN